jgi:hypothetical protein
LVKFFPTKQPAYVLDDSDSEYTAPVKTRSKFTKKTTEQPADVLLISDSDDIPLNPKSKKKQPVDSLPITDPDDIPLKSKSKKKQQKKQPAHVLPFSDSDSDVMPETDVVDSSSSQDVPPKARAKKAAAPGRAHTKAELDADNSLGPHRRDPRG